MKFGEDLYQKVYSEYKTEKAHDESKKDLVRRVYDSCKKFVINYTPFVGYLPVKTQQDLKDKSRKTFGSLNINTAVLASAIGLGLGAYFVGIHLDGFDVGFEMMQKVRFGGWGGSIGELPKYISFPFIWGGFSKVASDVVSYYLIGESAIRTAAALVGKPLGCLIGEAASYLVGRKSKSGKAMKEKEEEILRDEKQANYAKNFTERGRKENENEISKISQEIWEAKKAGEKEKESKLQLKLDSLINNLSKV